MSKRSPAMKAATSKKRSSPEMKAAVAPTAPHALAKRTTAATKQREGATTVKPKGSRKPRK